MSKWRSAIIAGLAFYVVAVPARAELRRGCRPVDDIQKEAVDSGFEAILSGYSIFPVEKGYPQAKVDPPQEDSLENKLKSSLEAMDFYLYFAVHAQFWEDEASFKRKYLDTKIAKEGSTYQQFLQSHWIKAYDNIIKAGFSINRTTFVNSASRRETAIIERPVKIDSSFNMTPTDEACVMWVISRAEFYDYRSGSIPDPVNRAPTSLQEEPLVCPEQLQKTVRACISFDRARREMAAQGFRAFIQGQSNDKFTRYLSVNQDSTRARVYTVFDLGLTLFEKEIVLRPLPGITKKALKIPD